MSTEVRANFPSSMLTNAGAFVSIFPWNSRSISSATCWPFSSLDTRITGMTAARTLSPRSSPPHLTAARQTSEAPAVVIGWPEA